MQLETTKLLLTLLECLDIQIKWGGRIPRDKSEFKADHIYYRPLASIVDADGCKGFCNDKIRLVITCSAYQAACKEQMTLHGRKQDTAMGIQKDQCEQYLKKVLTNLHKLLYEESFGHPLFPHRKGCSPIAQALGIKTEKAKALTIEYADQPCEKGYLVAASTVLDVFYDVAQCCSFINSDKLQTVVEQCKNLSL